MEQSFLNPKLAERNYLGLSDCSSVDSSNAPEVNKNSLNLKATELRLGLPGSQSPERDPESSLTSCDEKPLFPFLPSVSVASGHKRIFTDAMDSCSEVKGLSEGSWLLSASDPLKSGNSNVNGMISSGDQPAKGTVTNLNKVNTANPPAAKIRGFEEVGRGWSKSAPRRGLTDLF